MDNVIEIWMCVDSDGAGHFAATKAKAEKMAADEYGYDTFDEAKADGWVEGEAVAFDVPKPAYDRLIGGRRKAAVN